MNVDGVVRLVRGVVDASTLHAVLKNLFELFVLQGGWVTKTSFAHFSVLVPCTSTVAVQRRLKGFQQCKWIENQTIIKEVTGKNISELILHFAFPTPNAVNW